MDLGDHYQIIKSQFKILKSFFFNKFYFLEDTKLSFKKKFGKKNQCKLKKITYFIKTSF